MVDLELRKSRLEEEQRSVQVKGQILYFFLDNPSSVEKAFCLLFSTLSADSRAIFFYLRMRKRGFSNLPKAKGVSLPVFFFVGTRKDAMQLCFVNIH